MGRDYEHRHNEKKGRSAVIAHHIFRCDEKGGLGRTPPLTLLEFTLQRVVFGWLRPSAR
jgi:hypothetical protein